MPSVKASIYDGSVCVNQLGKLDLTGITAVQANGVFTSGGKEITADATSGDPTAHLKVGEEIFNESLDSIGIISNISSTVITLRNPSTIGLANNDYIYKYPKFEIAAIVCLEREDGGGPSDEPLFVDMHLAPIETKWASTSRVGAGASWAATANSDFGAYDAGSGVGLGSSMLLEILPGQTIYGRWSFCRMPNKNNSVLCYLKATPTRGKQNY
jgi:hypothetical protein